MAIMAALQQIDVALFDKVFHLGREYKAMTKAAITPAQRRWLSTSPNTRIGMAIRIDVGANLCFLASRRHAGRASHLLHHEEYA